MIVSTYNNFTIWKRTTLINLTIKRFPFIANSPCQRGNSLSEWFITSVVFLSIYEILIMKMGHCIVRLQDNRSPTERQIRESMTDGWYIFTTTDVITERLYLFLDKQNCFLIAESSLYCQSYKSFGLYCLSYLSMRL